MKIFSLFIFLFSFLISSSATAKLPAPSPALQQQRTIFTEAERAYKRGQLSRGKELSDRIKKYPLYPYLEYTRLSLSLPQQNVLSIEGFAKKNSDSPFANRLRAQWLAALAARSQWSELQANYLSELNDPSLHCSYLQSEINGGKAKRSELFPAIAKIWLSNASQPKTCDSVFRYWIKNGGLTKKLTWQRIELAMNTRKRNTMTKYLQRFLPANEQHYVDLWLKLDQRPKLVTNRSVMHYSHPIEGRIAIYALRRLAQKDEKAAIEAFETLKAAHVLTEQQRGEAMAGIGLILAMRNSPAASSWLKKVPDDQVNDMLNEWRVRNAIANQDWATVSYWINMQPEAMRNQEAWQYWLARAKENLHDQKGAHDKYEQISKNLTYYGLLSSERIKADYPVEHQDLDVIADDVAEVNRIPGIVRAREFYALKRLPDARREWEFTVSRLPTDQQIIAARIAKSWGWYDRAILTSRKANADDPDLLFPLVNSRDIIRASEYRRLNPAWTFSIAKQESLFIHDARSPVGALGLMQLMPRTAWHMAKETRTRYHNKSALFDIKTNISLGTAYLRKMADLYQQNIILAAAAYNAGPGNVRQWLPKSGPVEADAWIETIPFTETRLYVKNILTNIVMYEHQLGKKSKMKDHMKEIRGK